MDGFPNIKVLMNPELIITGRVAAGNNPPQVDSIKTF
jgi:hypothetical protein